MSRRKLALVIFCFLTLTLPRIAAAATITLAWDPSTTPNVAGYFVYVGTTSGNYTQKIDVGNATSYAYQQPVAGAKNFFAVSAYLAGGSESGRSNEVTNNGSPVLTNPGNRTNTVGQVVKLQLVGSDPEGLGVTFGATNLPPGLLLTNSTGSIDGTPTTAGSYNVTVSVSDGVSSVSQSFTWTIQPATVSDTTAPNVTITSPTSQSTFSTTATSITIGGTASDNVGVTQVTWARAGGGSGTATGTASWTSGSIPLQSGSNTITVTARDAAGNTDTDTLTVTVTLSTTGALPTGWSDDDIGTPAVAGSASYSNGTFTIRAGGNDIWDTSDQFHFVYQQVSGDVSIVARVASLTATNPWSKAGVMIRETLAGSSRNAAMIVSASNGLQFQRRTTTNVSSVNTNGTAAGAAPRWVRLERRGTTVTASYSSNGTSWTSLPSDQLTLPATFFVGLAVTSHDTGNATTAAIDSVSVDALTGPTPVQITSFTTNPASPQRVGTAVTLSAAASGGTTPYQFKFLVSSDGGSTFSVLRDWSTAASAAWTPSQANSAYRLAVWVRNAGVTANVADASQTLTYAITASTTALTLTKLVANLASPQPLGTSVTFTATASGAVAPYQYKWWVLDGATWIMARDWSTSASYAFSASHAGSYRVGVWVRDAQTTADSSAVNLSIPFDVSAGPTPPPPPPPPPSALTITALTANLSSPQPVGTSVTVTAAATGATAPYQYKWWVLDGATWIMVRDWSSSASYAFSASHAGSYRVGVWVRDANTTADSSAVNLSIPFDITATSSGPLTITALGANRTSPQRLGTGVTFTVSAAGAVAPYQYKWWVLDGSTWIMVRDWSTSGSYVFNASHAGDYRIGVWVRDARTTTDDSSVNLSVPFTVSP
jgi:regulation of enolase protein 1 (concanavalin A-like superfamily)